MGAQSAQVLENARQKEEISQGRVLIQEMEFAEAIQESLLPDPDPAFPATTSSGPPLPAEPRGRRLLRFHPPRDKRWAISLGDVSGKGLPAALLMSNLQATLRTLSHFVPSCHECDGRMQQAALPDHHPGQVRHTDLRRARHADPRPDLLQCRTRTARPGRRDRSDPPARPWRAPRRDPRGGGVRRRRRSPAARTTWW